MSDDYRDKLRSLGFSRHKGTSKTTVVPHERDGKTAGYQIEQWDDSVSAVVTPRPLNITTQVEL